MLSFLLQSGVLSTTFWAALLALCAAARDRRALPRLFSSWLFLAFVGVGACANVGLGLYKGYVVPRDFLQDAVSAQEFLAGRSLYPADMTERMRAAVEDDPPRFSLVQGLPDLSRREAEERHAALTQHW